MKNNQLFIPIILITLTLSLNTSGQVDAGFSASDTSGCNPLLIEFTNLGSSDAGYSYEWFFGSLATSTNENPSYTFLNSGSYEVIQVVTNTSGGETDTARLTIEVINTPNARLTIDSSNACIGGIVEFQTGFAYKDSAYWDFGDGTTSDEKDASYVTHIYYAHDVYNIQYITYNQLCSDTSSYSIRVDGPIAQFSVSPDAACKGTPMTFILGDTTDVQAFQWDVDEAGVTLTGDSANYSYEEVGFKYPSLSVSGASGTCTLVDTIEIFRVLADFSYSETQLCEGETVVFFNNSDGNDFNYWDLGNGDVSSTINASASYDAGDYTVRLRVESNEGCIDSTSQTISINAPPMLTFLTPEGTRICPGETFTLEASGGDIIMWSPAEAFDDPESFTPMINPDSSATYAATVTDTTTQCSSEGDINILVQEGFVLGKISVTPADTSIFTGDTIFVTFTDTLNRLLNYSWTPDIQMSCTDCAEPFLIPLETSTYQLMVSDDNQCEIAEIFEIHVDVTEAYRFGVPDAFTPNGDGRNDMIAVQGAGIRQLIEFSIYNRNGTQVFSTDDINLGWNGMYNGIPQPIDTYAYVIRAEMWNGTVQEEKGTFSLLR